MVMITYNGKKEFTESVKLHHMQFQNGGIYKCTNSSQHTETEEHRNIDQ